MKNNFDTSATSSVPLLLSIIQGMDDRIKVLEARENRDYFGKLTKEEACARLVLLDDLFHKGKREGFKEFEEERAAMDSYKAKGVEDGA